MASKFCEDYVCVEDIAPLALKGDEVRVRKDGKNFIVTNAKAGQQTWLHYAVLEEYFEPVDGLDPLNTLGV
ncbi:conserved hypothetical protein [Vibrio phage 275E43-1]|nr:conserved hypothetical protein [Vibrio phage 275E43-1]